MRLIDQTNNVEELRKENPSGNMSSILSSLMDLMSLKWPFFNVKTPALFFMSTHNIHRNRWLWHALP